ncbi:calcium-binding protein [Microcoleus vaginatus]|uniref:calcium-binding protein n=1 Tax=Microcoleus vaginatus TaxID=119532 RepID=UPI001F604360|nr:calcium-binding protein [Microcoleus vaginatus HSN003]
MATRTGTPGPDYLFIPVFFFRPPNDIIYGLAGNDTLLGLKGEDTLYGGEGDDCLYGGVGNDLLYGATGSDSLDGGTGNDGLSGGEDDDSLDGGTGNDTLYGEDGYYSLDGGTGDDLRVAHFRPDGSGGDDYLVGGSGNDLLYGGYRIDTVSYTSARTGINLQLEPVGDGSGLGRTTDGLGGVDSLSGLEVVIGSNFDDTLVLEFRLSTN